MKARAFLVPFLLMLVVASAAQAGCWRGRGWCGPRWGWGGGWCGPAVGVTFVSPAPIYRPVYYAPPTPVYVVKPASTLVRAQARLANLGYYRGAVDGEFGPLTNRALTLYQADYGLPVTGRLDRATLRSLGV
jgi:hypothetical protein